MAMAVVLRSLRRRDIHKYFFSTAADNRTQFGDKDVQAEDDHLFSTAADNQTQVGYKDVQPNSIENCGREEDKIKANLQSKVHMLADLNDRKCWMEGCSVVILEAVDCKDLRSIIELMKQARDRSSDHVTVPETLLNQVFCRIAESEHVDMQFGLDLLALIKEKLGVRPGRTSLDFLLSACVSSKDSKAALLIWKEYEAAGLPYNVISHLWMYRVLLACGERASASIILQKIPMDDRDVRMVVKACQEIYGGQKMIDEESTVVR